VWEDLRRLTIEREVHGFTPRSRAVIIRSGRSNALGARVTTLRRFVQ